MIQGNRFLISFILTAVAFISCQNTDKNSSIDNLPELKFHTSKQGKFVVTHPDGSVQTLLSDGISYEHQLSPDGKFLAVDYTKFSNLQLTKLFEKSENKRFFESENLSSIAWQRYKSNENTEIENVINPRSRVIKLTNDEAIVEISGMHENGNEFSKKISISLKD